MINHNDIQQGSIEWYEIRWGKIGGTLSKGLFVNSDTLMISLLAQHLEEVDLEDSYSSPAMERGKELEPFAKEYLEKYLKLKFDNTGWLQCEKNKLLGISPDGITKNLKDACEIKCLGRNNHTQTLLDNDIPKEYVFQCIHYFTVNPKLERLHFLCFRPESKKHFYKMITRNSEIAIGIKKDKELRPNAKGIDQEYVVTVPDVRTVEQWSRFARKEADLLLEQINENLNKLNDF
jgi:hypothetical protein